MATGAGAHQAKVSGWKGCFSPHPPSPHRGRGGCTGKSRAPSPKTLQLRVERWEATLSKELGLFSPLPESSFGPALPAFTPEQPSSLLPLGLPKWSRRHPAPGATLGLPFLGAAFADACGGESAPPAPPPSSRSPLKPLQCFIGLQCPRGIRRRILIA